MCITYTVNHPGFVALMLVDKRYLRCEDCNGLVSRAFRALRTSFVGHFVIVTHKIVPDSGEVLEEGKEKGKESKPEVSYGFVDPDSSKTRCRVSASLLEQARTAHGTDQDVLLIDTRHRPLTSLTLPC